MNAPSVTVRLRLVSEDEIREIAMDTVAAVLAAQEAARKRRRWRCLARRLFGLGSRAWRCRA